MAVDLIGDALKFGKRNGNVGTVTFAVLDRFARPLKVGSVLLYRPPMDLVFRVASIKPVLDPRAPTGLVELVLTTEVKMPLPTRQPQMAMVMLAEADQVPVDELPSGADTDAHGVGSESTPAAPAVDPGGDGVER